MSDKKKFINLHRKNTLLEKVILVDGQPGNGKSMLSVLLSSMQNIEHTRYSYLLEHICSLHYMQLIDNNVADVLIKLDLDNLIYDLIMGRNLNFRYKDLTSIFNSTKKIENFKRLFTEGDDSVPKIIKNKKPILNLIVHNFMQTGLPLFEAYKNKVFLIDLVRHPLYMVVQQHLYKLDHYEADDQSRNFTIDILKNGKQVPYWNYKNDLYDINSSPIEQVISDIYSLTKSQEDFRKKNSVLFAKQIITIPFEKFVFSPNNYLEEIQSKFEISPSKTLPKLMKLHKLPRKKLSDGIDKDIYRRCGWKPPQSDLSEFQELELRKKYVINFNPSTKYMNLLEELCTSYEEEHMKDLVLI